MSRRHLLSTATVLAFALGFGAGVLGAWLLEVPTDANPRAALAATRSSVGDLGPARLASLGIPGRRRGRHRSQPWPAGPGRDRTDPAPEVLSAALSSGLAREAELAGQARLAKAALPVPQRSTEQVTVRRGDTLIDILDRAGIAQAEAHAVVQSLRTVYDPRRLRAGQELSIRAEDERSGAGARRLVGLAFDLDFDHAVRVTRSADGRYVAAKVARPQRRNLLHRAGTIDDSLYMSAERAALPHGVIIGLIKLFSWDVDFQRDVQPGRPFRTGVRGYYDDEGNAAAHRRSVVRGAGDGRGMREFYVHAARRPARLVRRRRQEPALPDEDADQRRAAVFGALACAATRSSAIRACTRHRFRRADRHADPGRGRGHGARAQGLWQLCAYPSPSDYETAYAHLSRFARGVAPGRACARAR